jgi:hypothetical protein
MGGALQAARARIRYFRGTFSKKRMSETLGYTQSRAGIHSNNAQLPHDYEGCVPIQDRTPCAAGHCFFIEESNRMQKTPAELDHVHEERTATVQTREQQSFWGFTLNGSTSLEAVARFYGLKVPGPEPEITLGSYVGRNCYGSLRPGYRVAVGGAELRILEVEEGRVTKVGLEFLPVTLRQSRRRPHGSEPSVSRTASRLTEVADPPR